jgi:formate dehydrogenase subunit gamma
MQRSFYSLLLLVIVVLAGFTGSAMSAEDGLVVAGVPSGSSSDYYHELIGVITADWQKYGELFTNLQSQWFWKIFLGIVVAVPAVFLLHYLIIGPKHFDHDGPQIYFFSLFARIIHFIVAVSFTLIMITGLLMVFGKYLGGGTFIRGARYVHLVSAIVFVVPGY